MNTAMKKPVYLMANGDLRLSANQKCWVAQSRMEAILTKAVQAEGREVIRAHAYDESKQHGFIDSQKMGMEVFRTLDPDAPLIVAEAVWQYSHHLLHGLLTHRGPILTVANWSGTWPGLVGLLNLNGSMTKAGIRYSSLWSERFTDKLFKNGLRQWLTDGVVSHDQSHVRDLSLLKLPLADEHEGQKVETGPNDETDLTENQLLQQCKMYIAAVRIADDFGCATIGIQYQQGLKDLTPASDLVEGLLNNVDRPPVRCARSGRVLFEGDALPHFNEVDECAGLDGLVTYRLWRELGFPPENTLHDLRWGQHFQSTVIDDYVWVFLISGAAPPAHFVGGYKGTSSERQPAMYFRLGGGTVKGISKPGHIVWSRVFVMDGDLHCDLGVAEVVELPSSETARRWQETTPQWPIMHAVLKGITRDQMMARHKSNHIQVVYTPNEKQAHRGCRIKAAAMAELGLKVHLCGIVDLA